MYPGEILKVEDGEYFISTMKRIGINKLIERKQNQKDGVWYPAENIVTKITKPTKPTTHSRFCEISKEIWEKIHV